ncbi:hypothetical protein Ancab_023050 [Ancistrocladus abbreviatus]
MDEFGSKSSGNGGMQLDYYYYGNRPNPSYDHRSYSLGTPQQQRPSYVPSYDFKLKKSKTASGSSSKIWSFNDPEFQRKKRVASYRVYGVEGKVKGSFRKSFKWLKDRYFRLFHGE